MREVFAASHLDTTPTRSRSRPSKRGGLQRALAGQSLNELQRKIMDDMESQVVALMREEMSWTAMEPKMIELYRNPLTQRAVNDMLAWYTSPTGKSVVAKQPAAMKQMSEYAQLQVAGARPAKASPDTRVSPAPASAPGQPVSQH